MFNFTVGTFLALTLTESFVLLLDTFDQEPMGDERYVLMQIVYGDGNVAAVTAKLDVGVTGQHKVQAQIGYGTTVQIERFNLMINNI